MNWRILWERLQSLGFFVFAAIVLAGVAGGLFLPLMRQRSAMQSEQFRLDQELIRQEKLEKQQRTEIEALKTDSAFLERTARNTLNLAKPNEAIFRFEPAPATPSSSKR